MENRIVGEGSLELRKVAKAIETSESFAQLVEKWRSFGVNLDLKDEVLVDLLRRFKLGDFQIEDLPREIIAVWKANNGTQATLQKLCTALEDCGVRNIADTLSKKFHQSKSDEFMLNGIIYTLKQLVGDDASEESYKSASKRRKLNCPKKAIPLLREEVCPKEQPEYYISRTLLSRIELDERIFRDDSTKEHVFAVKGVTKSDLAQVSGFKIIERSGSQLQKLTVRFILLDHDDDFEKICKNTSKPAHMVEFKDGKFQWLKSTNRMDVIRKFMKKGPDESEQVKSDDSFGEEEAVKRIISKKFPSAFTITASPGMGKTVVLNSLALKIQESKPQAIQIFLVLQEFVKQICSAHLTSPDLDCILKYVTTDHYKKLILQKMLESDLHPLYLLLDGYDEVFEENLDFVDTLLQHLIQMRNVKVILTTRKHLTPRVENILKTLAFEIQSFSLQDQIDFLTRYWVTKHGAKEGESLQTFTHKCLNALQMKMTDDERNIAGSPLLCMMLAEVYADSARRASEIEEYSDDAVCVDELSFFHLYKSLINFKLSRIADSHTRRKYMDAHVHYAVNLLFPDWLEKFIPFLSPQDDIDENTLYSIGLMEKSPHSNTPRFVHRTFAEYLLADFVIDHVNKNKTCVEFLIRQILGKDGFTKHNYKDKLIFFSLKHSVIAYFFNLHLQDRFVNTPPTLNSLRLQNISAEDACIAAVSCCRNNLEGCFNLMATIIPRFKIRKQKRLKNEYLEHLIHHAVENTNSLSFVQRVLNLTKSELGVSLKGHVYQREYRLVHGLDISNCTPLHVAVLRGKYNIVTYLLQEYGQDVLSIKHLLHACVYGSAYNCEFVVQEKLSIIQALIKRNKEWLEEERDSRIPLLEDEIHVQIAEGLVTLGTDINAYSCKYGTLLHTGGHKNSYTDLVRWAIGNGFNSNNEKDDVGATPLMRAILNYRTVDDEVLHLLSEAGADFNAQDNKGFSVLFYVIKYSGSSHLLQKILDFRADPNHRDKEGMNAAHLVLDGLEYGEIWNSNDLVEMLKLLKSSGFSGLNEKDNYGRTPIMLAVKTEVTLENEILVFLHEEGVDFNAQDNCGDSVLFYAVQKKGRFEAELIHRILNYGADPNHTNRKRQNAAHSVMEFWSYHHLEIEILKLLIANGFDQLDKQDIDGRTPLMSGIHSGRSFKDELFGFFHEKKVNFNAQDNHGNSVLFYAIQFSYTIDNIQKVLDFGANPTHRGEVGRNAAHVVLNRYEHNRSSAVKLLELLKSIKSMGFEELNEMDDDGCTPITAAIRLREVIQDKMNKFFSEVAVNAQNNNGKSEFRNKAHLALNICNPDPNLAVKVLKLLKTKGFGGFNEMDDNGCTPIITAIRSRGVIENKTLKFLSEEAVDFNARDNDGNSVLFYAIRHTRNIDFIKEIIDLGANPNHRNLKCQNAGHWAILNYERVRCEKEEEQEDGCKRKEDPNRVLEIVKFLESRGFVGFNDRDCNGDTPLKLAIDQNISDDELLKFLRIRTFQGSGKKRKLVDTQDM